MSVEATVLPAAMLGISGLVVLAVGEYGGELELLVETSESVTGCPRCGVVAVAHGRREHLVRETPRRGGRCCWCGASGCGGAPNRRARNVPGQYT